MADPTEILCVVLSEYADADKWIGSPFERIKRISNSHVGSVGQDFIQELCSVLGFKCEKPENKRGPWDLRIEGVEFEVKTATEDVGGNFQFNHLRYHRPYDAALCVGIGPDSIYFGMWSKAEVSTGKAGKLVSMEKGANASYRLTKRKDGLEPIGRFSDVLTEFIVDFLP
jgi:hypothetical protein